MSEEIKYNEIEDLDYCLELLEDRDKENYSLSQENSFLKYHIGEKDKEIERLNNIINELEKWLKEEIRIFEDGKDDEYEGLIYNAKIIILDKLQELKGSNKQ